MSTLPLGDVGDLAAEGFLLTMHETVLPKAIYGCRMATSLGRFVDLAFAAAMHQEALPITALGGRLGDRA
ncbi:MAG: hypothetical protein OEU92_05280 [Alphaproteobacteria bacterium]|nr:hypothetical protein [Alphaproteobacteria bacterium]